MNYEDNTGKTEQERTDELMNDDTYLGLLKELEVLKKLHTDALKWRQLTAPLADGENGLAHMFAVMSLVPNEYDAEILRRVLRLL